MSKCRFCHRESGLRSPSGGRPRHVCPQCELAVVERADQALARPTYGAVVVQICVACLGPMVDRPVQALTCSARCRAVVVGARLRCRGRDALGRARDAVAGSTSEHSASGAHAPVPGSTPRVASPAALDDGSVAAPADVGVDAAGDGPAAVCVDVGGNRAGAVPASTLPTSDPLLCDAEVLLAAFAAAELGSAPLSSSPSFPVGRGWPSLRAEIAHLSERRSALVAELERLARAVDDGVNAVRDALVEYGFVPVPHPCRGASFEVDVQVPAVEPAHRATVLLPLPGVECVFRLDASREGWTVAFPGTLVEVSAEPLDPCAVWSVADPEWADYASVVTCALWRISLEDHVCVERWSLLVEGDFYAFDARLLRYVVPRGDGPRGDFESQSLAVDFDDFAGRIAARVRASFSAL